MFDDFDLLERWNLGFRSGLLLCSGGEQLVGRTYVRGLSGALKRNERVLGESRISTLTNGETEPRFSTEISLLIWSQ